MTVENPTKTAATIGQSLPWTAMMLDYTEQLTDLIPENLLDWRLSDPSGKWHFSLAEIAMHCADSRRMFARQLSGQEREDDFWSAGAGEDGIWPFRSYGSKEAILASLREARGELDAFLDRPATDLLATTEGTRRIFERALAQMREKGQDTTALETRGPANIVRIVMALIAHESGHRANLQTLLRMHGINAPER